MKYSYGEQVNAIREMMVRLVRPINAAPNPTELNPEYLYEVLNCCGATIAALNLSDPYKEIERLRNDLLDALDLKKGEGPTALTMLKSRAVELERQLKEANDIISHYADVNQNQ